MTILNFGSTPGFPPVLHLSRQLPHIAGVLGGASRTTRTTKGVVPHANHWKEESQEGDEAEGESHEEARRPQSRGETRSSQDCKAQSRREEESCRQKSWRQEKSSGEEETRCEEKSREETSRQEKSCSAEKSCPQSEKIRLNNGLWSNQRPLSLLSAKANAAVRSDFDLATAAEPPRQAAPKTTSKPSPAKKPAVKKPATKAPKAPKSNVKTPAAPKAPAALTRKSSDSKSTAAPRTKRQPKSDDSSAENPSATVQTAPIEFYYWPNPNCWKIAIMLEECGVPYVLRPVDINNGDQFADSFLSIAPNNRVPAIVDPEGPDGSPITVFESGAILQYLGRKTGQFYPKDERARILVDQWLFWQMAGLGPMAGQVGHFRNFARTNTYSLDRYTNEVHRLLGVLNRRLIGRDYIADDYSIADMAAIGWVIALSRADGLLQDFPHVKSWMERVVERPAVSRGVEVGKDLRSPPADAAAQQRTRRILFNQRGFLSDLQRLPSGN